MRRDKERFTVPRSVQQTIPIQRIWQDGLFYSGSRYSQSWRFSDINYLLSGRTEKEQKFHIYSALLNAQKSGCYTQVTICNHSLDRNQFAASVLLPEREDGRGRYRDEYNQFLLEQAIGEDTIVQERYVTISDRFKTPEDARMGLGRAGADLMGAFFTPGFLMITDAMINRVSDNWRSGKRTHLITDEFHVMLGSQHGAEFFDSAWRRYRKRTGFPVAATQNVEFLLDTVHGSTMVSNSECVVMLNQSMRDAEKLIHLFHISEDQARYITNAQAGSGLLQYAGTLIPFVNRFKKDTELYRLITTKPGEVQKKI
ncbi:MAG TPA: hypothetical protein IAC97_05730 [Candidatus Pelethousia gallinarum]|nr:hypothetical protein [Candidatus Pelethousia gallinarum]